MKHLVYMVIHGKDQPVKELTEPTQIPPRTKAERRQQRAALDDESDQLCSYILIMA